jgi:hypothetical protein
MRFYDAEWSNDSATINSDDLAIFTESPNEVQKLKTCLQPSLSQIGGLTSASCVEVTPLSLKGNSTELERAVDMQAISDLKRCVRQDIPSEVQSTFFCLSTPDTLPEVPSKESPSGSVDFCVAVVGWKSLQQHHEMWKTEQFKGVIPSVLGRLAPTPAGLEMSHAAYTSI